MRLIFCLHGGFLIVVLTKEQSVKKQPPKNLPGISDELKVISQKLADEFATPGTVKHFALRLGFMPCNEEDAEAILDRLIREKEWFEWQLEICIDG